MHFRIGTRGSKLAVWQAEYIAGLLKEQMHSSEIVTFETKGDKQLEVSIVKIGSKGVFTEELEEALFQGTIDLAVHSAKDLQSELPPGLEIIAFSERERENDVVVSLDPNFKIGKCEAGTLVGSSSTRRRAMMHRHFPHVTPVEIRGNLQTRFRKLEEGQAVAMLLAYAGVKRLGMEKYIVEELSVLTFVPPAGQGSLALEISSNLNEDQKLALRSACNHRETEICLLAERAYLNRLQGGCSIPVFAHSTPNGRFINLHAGIIALDGQEAILQIDRALANEDDAKKLGITVAEYILAKGGDRILSDIRAFQNQ
jgi:hydroxymethylbilane synthase